MRCLVEGLLRSLVLLLLLMPGIAMARSTIEMARLPSEMMVANLPDYRLRALADHIDRPRLQPAATRERLLVPLGGVGGLGQYHSAVLATGRIEILAEAMRRRVPIAIAGFGREAQMLDHRSAVGVAARWSADENDSFSLRLAASASKRAEPAILAGRKSIKGDGIVAECAWSHDTHLRMSFDWRADRSASSGGLNRIVELAQGATLSERGFGLSLAYLVAGAEASRGTTFGIAARDARVAADDLATIGSTDRHDVQAAVFVRAAF